MIKHCVWIAAGLLAVRLIAAGCKKKEGSEKKPEEKAEARPRPEDKAAGRKAPGDKGPPKDRARPGDAVPAKDTPPVMKPFKTKDGAINVSAPSGPAWDCMDRQVQRGTQKVSMIRCRPKDRSQFFFMIAKVYTVPAKDVMDAKKLVTVQYPKHYKKFFQSHKIVKSGPFKHQNHEGYEIHLQARHSAKGDIMKVERVLVKGTNVLILSAEGAPGPYKKFQPLIKQWFDGARFQILGK